MIGGFLSLLSAVTFAYANASVRRGVLTGTVLQAVAISLPVALPFFLVAMAFGGGYAASELLNFYQDMGRRYADLFGGNELQVYNLSSIVVQGH
jgi:hypothetical protein